MAYYRIAELTVDMNPQFDLLKKRLEKYEIPPCNPDIVLRMPDGFLEKKMKESPTLSNEECEYAWMGLAFSAKLWKYQAVTIHASAVAVDGNVYLFSADSGVGKTTHTQLWLRRFPNAFILDDDKPVIRLTERGLMVYGTPFSGTSEENRNMGLPLASLTFLERDDHNWIKRLDDKAASVEWLRYISKSRKPDHALTKLTLLDHVLKSVPVCRMGCTVDDKAAEMAYQFIEENRR